jgi:CelD/BcsL family acetyltransferase involved in cellulose biosynthesis
VDRNLRLILLREIPEVPNLREQWNALVERMEQPQVFYTWEWALAVQRAYSASLHPLLFLAYDEQDSLCGVAALATDAQGRQVSFLCATTGDYCDFVGSAEHRPALVAEVLEELRKQGKNDFTLTNLPADSDTVAALRQASAKKGYHCFMRTAYECAQVSFERLERGKDGKPVAPGKKRVRRFAKAMAAEGPVQFDHIRSWDEVAPLLPKFLRAHVVRFLEIGRISNFVEARRRLFLTELSKLLSQPQWLVFSRMSVAGRVYAWHHGFQFCDNWFWYQPTFDSSVEKHWPGFCLLTQVIQDATEMPALKKLDLGLGAEAYKAKFANATRRTMCVTLHRSRLKHWQEMVRHYLVRAIAAQPGTERAMRNLMAKAKSVRSRVHQAGLSSTLAWLASRIAERVVSRDEVFFFESNSTPNLRVDGNLLQPLSFDLLAEAAMRYYDDEETLEYLRRSAARLRERGAEGFALLDASGEALHFAWVTAFEGFFLAELNAKTHAPDEDCVLLFDCWTPAQARGHGYFAQTITVLADCLRRQGKKPWIFSAARNVRSLRGLEKSGFQRRYSLTRQRTLLWQRIKGTTPRRMEETAAETSARVRAS